jgi:hypothetical protein
MEVLNIVEIKNNQIKSIHSFPPLNRSGMMADPNEDSILSDALDCFVSLCHKYKVYKYDKWSADEEDDMLKCHNFIIKNKVVPIFRGITLVGSISIFWSKTE